VSWRSYCGFRPSRPPRPHTRTPGSSFGKSVTLELPESSHRRQHQQHQQQHEQVSLLTAGRYFSAHSRLPNLDQPSAILKNDDQLASLASAIPDFDGHWKLKYSTSYHGFSLGTLYRRAPAHGACLLICEDLAGHTFGAYTTEPWHVRPKYYGTGETFVFQLDPARVAFRWVHGDQDPKKYRGGSTRSPTNGASSSSLSTPPSSVKQVPNEFFQLAFKDSLAVGGSPAFALWFDSDLREGHSNYCGTFESPCLASTTEFQVRHLEVWGVGGGGDEKGRRHPLQPLPYDQPPLLSGTTGGGRASLPLRDEGGPGGGKHHYGRNAYDDTAVIARSAAGGGDCGDSLLVHSGGGHGVGGPLVSQPQRR